MIRKTSIRVPIVRQRRDPETLLAILIGLSVSLLIVFALFGCRDTPNTATALDAANKALVAVDIAADTTLAELAYQRESRLAACRAQDLPTPEAREACMGPWAEPLAPKAEAAAEAYDATVEALAALAEALSAIEAFAREAQ